MKNKINIPVVRLRKFSFILSSVLVLAAVILIIVPGFNRGIDFESGLALTVEVKEGGSGAPIADVRSALKKINVTRVQSVGSADGGVFQLRMGLRKDATDTLAKETEALVTSTLASAFEGGSVKVLESNFIGAKFSSSLLRNSLLAVAVAVVLILLYVWMRFELGYALCAVIALVHDVLCMLGFIVIARFEVSSTTIASVLTIIGYSLNNTIVIMDRIRDYLRAGEGEPDLQVIVDRSVSASFSRTTISSVTTLLAIIPLCIFSSGDIYAFVMSLLVGIVIGTYSSNFIAPALLYCFDGRGVLDPRRLKERSEKKVPTDEEEAAYLIEDEVIKARAMKFQPARKKGREKDDAD